QHTASATACAVVCHDTATCANVVIWLFGGNAALQRTAIDSDRFLAQSQIFQGCASCNLHLRCHDVNTSDLFGHGVLDLHTWVHFDEHMVSAFIDQELDGASTFVFDVLTEVHGIL